MITRIKNLQLACLLGAALGMIISVPAIGQENLIPAPDDDLIGKKCPHQLAFIHYQIYYYVVKDCSDASTSPFLAGFRKPVSTGCSKTGDCNSGDSVVMIPEGQASATTNSKGPTFPNPGKKVDIIPGDQADSADFIFMKPGYGKNGPIFVKVPEGAGHTYWLLNYMSAGTNNANQFYSAIKLSSEPTGQTCKMAKYINDSATNDIIGIEYNSTGYWVISNQ